MTSKLLGRGFLSLITTQFFGAANDNILKGVLIYMVIDGAWAGQLGSGGQGIVSICFTVPFILLSGYAGQFADRNSKRDVSVMVKVLEIPIALLALVGFWLGNLWVTLLALIALTCQSAFFGPAKYGMIPELVPSQDLSRANGTINMMTNIAVIVGTLAAGAIADAYSPLPDAGGVVRDGTLWLPGAAMLIIAVAGLISVLFLPALEPGDRTLAYDLNPFATYNSVIKEMFGTSVMMVMFAWGYFYFLAGLALLILPEYTVVLQSYNVSRAEVSVLLGVMGVAIGVGSGLCGLISGHAIRPRLIPIGAAGLTLFFLLLGLVPPWLPNLQPMWRVLASPIAAMVFGAGMSAGFYIVPLQALLQRLSPDAERGRFLGTANGISFAFLTLASLLYWAIRPAFGVQPGQQHPEKIFIISSLLMILGVAFFLWRLRARGFTFAKVD
jgi:acyl-[acyl-carrier-protein]-phospholipid O-acyltransferase/long-chain-fatty-acid--[acyl-carrier-protein] ligase